METATFDGITRNLGGSITRRGALRGLFAGAVAAAAGGAVLQADDASARRRRKKAKKGKKNQSQTLPPGAFCQRNSQCQTNQGYICEVPVNAGNSDKTCSGATGAVCGAPNADGDDTAPFCAVGHYCALTSQSNQAGTGICQRVPEEI